MNKKFAVVIILITLLVMSTFIVFAGGGKVRGGNAKGPATQTQVHYPQGWSWP